MQSKIILDSIVYSDVYHSYNILDVSEFKHYRINRSKLCADKKITLMEWRIFGIRPKGTHKNLMVSYARIFRCF